MIVPRGTDALELGPFIDNNIVFSHLERRYQGVRQMWDMQTLVNNQQYDLTINWIIISKCRRHDLPYTESQLWVVRMDCYCTTCIFEHNAIRSQDCHVCVTIQIQSPIFRGVVSIIIVG
jgi:hypothetical protein